MTRPARIWSEAAGSPEALPIVLVHGSMDRSAGLLRLSRRLDDRCRVIRYDRRGYGRSSAVGPPWDVTSNIDDLASLVAHEATDGRRVVLFGHSFGGNVALGLAARHPELVAAVTVYETPLSWFDWWPRDSAGGMAIAAADPADSAEAFMRRLVGDAVWERLPAAKQAERRAEGAAMVGELGDLRRHAPWDAADIGAPVLALCGARGHAHHRAGTATLVEILDDCRSLTIPGAGHAGPHTHAADVADTVCAFIDEVAAEPIAD